MKYRKQDSDVDLGFILFGELFLYLELEQSLSVSFLTKFEEFYRTCTVCYVFCDKLFSE